MFLDFVTKPYIYVNVANYLRNGGETTLRNMVKNFDEFQWHSDSYVYWATEIMTEYADLVEFVHNLKHYHKIDDYVFVHAGINPHLRDWQFTDTQDYIWIRDQFLNHDHNHDETFIHGHTPCQTISGRHDIIFGNKKINIDGACAYGGQLNCLEIKDGEFKQFSVKSNN